MGSGGGPWPAGGLAPAVRGGLVSGLILSGSSISARPGRAGLPAAHPLPDTHSSAREVWLWEGQVPLSQTLGPCSALPHPPGRPIHPLELRVDKYCKSILAGGERCACPSVGCFSEPPRHGWSSGEAISLLPPPLPPVIEPLKWRLILQSV